MRSTQNLLGISFILVLVIQLMAHGQGASGLNELPKEERRQFFNALYVVGTEKENQNTWATIEKIFESDEVGLCLLGIRILSGKAQGIPESRPKIISFLADVAVNTKDSITCLRATSAIAKYRDIDGVDEALVSALRKLLKDEDSSIRHGAVHIALYDRLEIAIPILKEAMAEEEEKWLKEYMAKVIASLEKGIWGRIGVRTALIANMAAVIITNFLIAKIFLCVLIVAVVALLIRKKLHRVSQKI